MRLDSSLYLPQLKVRNLAGASHALPWLISLDAIMGRLCFINMTISGCGSFFCWCLLERKGGLLYPANDVNVLVKFTANNPKKVTGKFLLSA